MTTMITPTIAPARTFTLEITRRVAYTDAMTGIKHFALVRNYKIVG